MIFYCKGNALSFFKRHYHSSFKDFLLSLNERRGIVPRTVFPSFSMTRGFSLKPGEGAVCRSMAAAGPLTFSLIKKSAKNQGCIPLCYPFSKILNKIELASLRHNFVFNGFSSKVSRSRNARPFSSDSAYCSVGVQKDDLLGYGERGSEATGLISVQLVENKVFQSLGGSVGMETSEAAVVVERRRFAHRLISLDFFFLFDQAKRKCLSGKEDKKTKISLLTIISLLLCCSIAMAQSGAKRIATEDIKPLQIGDTIPEPLWNMPLQVVNHPERKHSVKLGDFRGKGILLDFMSTSCKACIEALPGMEQVVKSHHNDVVLLPITSEGRDRLLRFIPHNDYLRDLKLTYVVEDKDLRAIFPHSYISHVVWIDPQGVIRSFTGTKHVTASTISGLLEGNTLGWPVKSEMTSYFHQPIISANQHLLEMPNNRSQKMHYAGFTGYLEGVGPYYPTAKDSLEGVERISIRNVSLLDFGLIASGLGLFKRGNILKQEHGAWKVAQAGHYAYELYEGEELTKEQWYQKYAISYERTVPMGMNMQEKQSIMRRDLQSFLEISVEQVGNELLFYEHNLYK